MRNATPTLQPYATWNPIRGAWETAQLDLYGQPARCSGTWPTCGWTHDGSAYRLPLSALLTPGVGVLPDMSVGVRPGVSVPVGVIMSRFRFR